MASTREEEKPWKTDLARKSALRRESVLHEVEEAIKKASSFEDALKQSVEIMKKRFGRYSAITAYVADGEDLAVHTSLERPAGPDRIWSGGGPLADAAHGHVTTKVSALASQPLWAVLEVWSDFRDAFTPHDVKLMDKVVAALAKKTPAA